ncbi:MAG: hypothetical protein ACLQU4_13155 [Limisphaerales bacterium]
MKRTWFRNETAKLTAAQQSQKSGRLGRNVALNAEFQKTISKTWCHSKKMGNARKNRSTPIISKGSKPGQTTRKPKINATGAAIA